MNPGLYWHENRGITNLAIKRMGGKPSAQEQCHPISGQWRVEGEVVCNDTLTASTQKRGCGRRGRQPALWLPRKAGASDTKEHRGESGMRALKQNGESVCETRPIYTQYPDAQNPSHQLPTPSPNHKERREGGGREGERREGGVPF